MALSEILRSNSAISMSASLVRRCHSWSSSRVPVNRSAPKVSEITLRALRSSVASSEDEAIGQRAEEIGGAVRGGEVERAAGIQDYRLGHRAWTGSGLTGFAESEERLAEV